MRALVLDVGRPADWDLLGAVWRGVQLDLGLPAPGIAIAGEDSYQLWFSLQAGCEAGQGAAFLAGLKAHYLGAVPASRVRCFPSVEAAGLPISAPPVPAQVREGQWSAFVAADLAPVFVESPWLDIPPGAEGQADLLKELQSITPPAWAAALDELGSTRPVAPAVPVIPIPTPTPSVDAVAGGPATGFTDPRAFLLHVMNDASVPMPLRIEAAKALLPRA